MKASKWLLEVERLRGKHDPLNEKIAMMLADVEDLGYRRGFWDTTLFWLIGHIVIASAIGLTKWVMMPLN